MMNNKLETVCNASLYVLTALQTNQVFQIIELCLSIATSIFILISRIYNWYKEAKKDGKITSDEIKEGVDIVSEGVEEIKDKLDKSKGEETHGNNN